MKWKGATHLIEIFSTKQRAVFINHNSKLQWDYKRHNSTTIQLGVVLFIWFSAGTDPDSSVTAPERLQKVIGHKSHYYNKVSQQQKSCNLARSINRFLMSELSEYDEWLLLCKLSRCNVISGKWALIDFSVISFYIYHFFQNSKHLRLWGLICSSVVPQ